MARVIEVARVRALELRPFTDDVIDDAARLLADRHRRQRLEEPGLSAAFEEVAVARAEVQALAGRDGASGAVATSGGAVVGYVIGTPRAAATWGPNIWVEAAGHAVADGQHDLVRDLYGSAATQWVEEGRTSHSAVVPATDPALVDAWFGVGFGQQHVHAIREVLVVGESFRVPAGLTIRRAVRDDIPALATLELELPAHQGRSPVFSRLDLPSLAETLAELEGDFGDPRFETFIAQHEGRVIGSAVGCSIEISSEHTGLTRPPDAGFLGFAAVLPEARGLGAGRALGEAVIAWSRDAGYATVATDWRQTNLLSSRTWPRLGFRPTFRRLHRAIA
jgi:ribosomal protein S18 acetylase RimI-like enzyme